MKNYKHVILKENSIYKIIYRRFKTLIKENNSFKHSVEFYAKQLSISPSHLTRICRKVANETPKKIIALYFINDNLMDCEVNMQKIVDYLATELTGVQIGRANK